LKSSIIGSGCTPHGDIKPQSDSSQPLPEQPNEVSVLPGPVHLRRSTDRQEQSISDQRKAVRRYADERGFELLTEYVDDAISGTSHRSSNFSVANLQTLPCG
jgi:hypothetical protein